MIKFIKELLYGKKKYDYPNEFILIKFTENAQKYALFEDMNKEIEYHNGDIVRNYPYSEEFIETMNVPYFDMTGEEFKIPIIKKINPAVVNYEQEVE